MTRFGPISGRYFTSPSLAISSYFTNPRRTSSIAITVGFLEEVGSDGRAPFCNCRARLAATMMKRLMLCSGSSGIEQWVLFRTVFSDIVTALISIQFKGRQNRLDLRLHTDPAHSLGQHNCGQRIGGRLQVIVHKHVIVLAVIPDLTGGIAQSPCNHLIG